MNIRIFESSDDVVAATARTILQRVPAEGPASIALSGGRSPVPLFHALRGQLIDRDITWLVVDERFVPLEDPQSNAGSMQKTLFRDGIPARHHFLHFRTGLPDAAECADAFEKEWNALGLKRLDVVVLGVGEDGHTASLFPNTEAPEVNDRIATAVYVPRLEQWRVTITMPVIRDAGVRLVMVTGASKAPVVRDVREGVRHPITLATEGVETWWLVDREAAGERGA